MNTYTVLKPASTPFSIILFKIMNSLFVIVLNVETVTSPINSIKSSRVSSIQNYK